MLLHDNATYQAALEGLVQALIDRSIWRPRNAAFALGVEHLDLFENRTLTVTHPAYATWMLLRYFELVAEFLFFTLACETVPRRQPQDIFTRACITFGGVVTQSYRLVVEMGRSTSASSWPAFFGRLLQDEARLARLRNDRNDFAHGREIRLSDDIEEDVKAFKSAVSEERGQPTENVCALRRRAASVPLQEATIASLQ